MTPPNEPGWYPDPAPGRAWRYWNGQYWTQHTTTDTPPTSEPATPQADPGDPRPPRSRPKIIAWALAVVLLLGVGAGTAFWLTGTTNTGQWTRVAHDPEVFGKPGTVAMMTSVAAGDDGLVAIGSSWDPNHSERSVGAVWTSDDGTSWERVPHDDAVFGKPAAGTAMWGVTAGGPGFVAVGTDRIATDKDNTAAVWTSEDGTSWQRVPHQDVFGRRGEGSTSMRAVTAGGPGLVAVGDTENGAAVWTSKDGRHWARASHRDSGFEPPGKGAMRAVTTGGPGLVAAGTEKLPGYGRVAAVWTSTDGTQWRREHHNDATFGDIHDATEINSVTSGPQGLVAVGEAGEDLDEGGLQAAAWRSKDGKTWTRLPHNDATFGKRDNFATAKDVLATDHGFVAVGTASDRPGGDIYAAVWTSPDGTRWQRLPRPDAFGPRANASSEVWSVVPIDEGLAAVGSAIPHGQTEGSGAAWFKE